MDSVAAVEQAFEHHVRLRHLQAFHVGIGQHSCGVVADHAAPVARRRPLGEEPALLIYIYQPFLHLQGLGGVHQVEEGKEAAEGIPEACVGVHIAGQDLAVVGAVVHDIAVSRNLVELAGEEQRTVEAGIECTHVVDILAADLDASEHIVPCGFAGSCHLIETHVAELLQILESLLVADEGRRHPGMHYLAFAGRKAYHRTGMLSLGGRHTFGKFAVGKSGLVCERLVKLDDKAVAEIGGHPSPVHRRISDDPAV